MYGITLAASHGVSLPAIYAALFGGETTAVGTATANIMWGALAL